jgi:hypothetical protein
MTVAATLVMVAISVAGCKGTRADNSAGSSAGMS